MDPTEFIDFTIFTDYADKDFMICEKSKNHEHHLNQYIEGVDKSEGIEIINQARISFGTDSFTKIKDKYISKNVTADHIIDTIFYKSTDNAYYCFFTHLYYDATSIYMCGLLNRQNGKYLVIGALRAHAFIKHHMFDYTDVSGHANCVQMDCVLLSDLPDDEKVFLTSKSKPPSMLDTLENYFNTICNNELYPAYVWVEPVHYEQKTTKVIICNPTYGADNTDNTDNADNADNDHTLKNVGILNKKSGKSIIRLHGVRRNTYYAWAKRCNYSAGLAELVIVADGIHKDDCEWEYVNKIAIKDAMCGIFDLKYYDKSTIKPCVKEAEKTCGGAVLPYGIAIYCGTGSYDVFVNKEGKMITGIRIVFEI